MSRGYRLPPDKMDRARVARGWSVADLAREAGLSIATASRALAGRPVSGQTLRGLGRAFRQHPPHPDVRVLLEVEMAESNRVDGNSG
jgi:transcriptional regulator with XRE-family HTH domain